MINNKSVASFDKMLDQCFSALEGGDNPLAKEYITDEFKFIDKHGFEGTTQYDEFFSRE